MKKLWDKLWDISPPVDARSPVFPGDTLRLQHTILETRPMGKRPDVGLVHTLWEMFNQNGDKVLLMDGWSMFRRRTPAAAAPA